MKNYLKLAGVAMAAAIAGCGGETSANGSDVTVSSEDADTSQNWVEVVSKTEEGGFIMGNPDAPIQVVEFASLTCGACGAFAAESFEPLTEEYISTGLVSFEIRNFVRDPLDLSAAVLSRCSGEAPYFTLTERLFENQNQMFQTIQQADQTQLQQLATREAVESGAAFVGFAQAAGLIDYVGGLGISADRARECLTDSAAVQELEQMRTQAINQHNVQATPTFLINGEVAANVLNWASLQARLDEMIE